MKKMQMALGIGIAVLGAMACVTAKSAWDKSQSKSCVAAVLASDSSGAAAEVYLSDDPVEMGADVGKEDLNKYPWESEWYGPYEEADYQSEKYHLWYDENGIQSHHLKEGYQELNYESVSCIEHTGDSETVLVYDGSYTPYAEQKVGEAEMAKFWERRAEGLPAYALQDEEGFVAEWSESDDFGKGIERERLSGSYYLGFRWKMEGGMCYYGGNEMKRGTPVMYSTIQVHVEQSRKGKSYLVLKNQDTGEKVRILGSETEDGWDGTIKMGSIPEALYSIGIENASGEEITYRGMYGYY